MPARHDGSSLDLSGPSSVMEARYISEDTTECYDGAITGPSGLEAFRLEAYSHAPGAGVEQSPRLLGYAELWIWVAP
jgi:hypothetical protein